MSPFAAFDASKVKGNVSDEVKELVESVLRSFMYGAPHGFADTIGARTKVVEISIKPKEFSSRKEEATVICELDVQQDMVNGGGNLHGGCSAYLVDICTSLPLAAILQRNPGVSQSINMVYHAPAVVGTPLRIVSTSIAVGGRTVTARGEIWDTQNGRLVASGVHTKMVPSEPKL